MAPLQGKGTKLVEIPNGARMSAQIGCPAGPAPRSLTFHGGAVAHRLAKVTGSDDLVYNLHQVLYLRVGKVREATALAPAVCVLELGHDARNGAGQDQEARRGPVLGLPRGRGEPCRPGLAAQLCMICGCVIEVPAAGCCRE